jgi:hypothetical protein
VVCRLPIAAGGAPLHGEDGPAGGGGFWNAADDTFRPDPASLGAFDREAGRWLPVAPGAIQPGGQRYAYSVPGGRAIRVMGVAGDPPQTVSEPQAYQVIGFRPEGVYLAGGPPAAGVYLETLRGDPLHKVTDQDRGWALVGQRYAFASDVDPSDPRPPPGAPNRILQVDLADGGISAIYYSAGHPVRLVGVDSRGFSVAAVDGPGAFSIAIAGRVAGSAAATGGPDAARIVSATADGDREWLLAADGGVWALLANGSLRRVGRVAVPGARFGGGCS